MPFVFETVYIQILNLKFDVVLFVWIMLIVAISIIGLLIGSTFHILNRAKFKRLDAEKKLFTENVIWENAILEIEKDLSQIIKKMNHDNQPGNHFFANPFSKVMRSV